MFKKNILIFAQILSQTANQILAEEVVDYDKNPEMLETLILTDNEAVYATHSVFQSDLREQGHRLTLKYMSSEDIISKKLSLMEDGEYVYQNIIIMSTSIEDLTKSSVFDIHDFFDKGGNILFMDYVMGRGIDICIYITSKVG